MIYLESASYLVQNNNLKQIFLNFDHIHTLEPEKTRVWVREFTHTLTHTQNNRNLPEPELIFMHFY